MLITEIRLILEAKFANDPMNLSSLHLDKVFLVEQILRPNIFHAILWREPQKMFEGLSQFFITLFNRGMFRILSNIYDGVSLQKQLMVFIC